MTEDALKDEPKEEVHDPAPVADAKLLMEKLVQDLDELHQKVLQLIFSTTFTHDQIAYMTNTTPENVRLILHRFKKQVKHDQHN
jgi:DNA-directed RNA polymerase specialized sigma24 family protein